MAFDRGRWVEVLRKGMLALEKAVWMEEAGSSCVLPAAERPSLTTVHPKHLPTGSVTCLSAEV